MTRTRLSHSHSEQSNNTFLNAVGIYLLGYVHFVGDTYDLFNIFV